jgi:hypothetical protein
VVIAVRGTDAVSVDFAFLSQESLPQAQAEERRGAVRAVLPSDSPLGRLLLTARYGEFDEGRRGLGLDAAASEDYSARLFQWTVRPAGDGP